MSVSLSGIATAMADAATIITSTSSLFGYVGGLMETVENAYTGDIASGSTKLAAVLAGLQALATELGEDFSSIEAQITAWIATVKAAYNAAVSAVSGKAAATANAVSNAAASTATAAV